MEEKEINWGSALVVGAFVGLCAFAGDQLIEMGKTLLAAKKASKKG